MLRIMLPIVDDENDGVYFIEASRNERTIHILFLHVFAILQINKYYCKYKFIDNKQLQTQFSYQLDLKWIDMSKQTVLKNLAYLGAAMSEGQGIKGVQKAPQIIRQTGIFAALKRIYGVNVNDYGDVAVNHQDRTKYPQLQFPIKNLNILGPYMGRLHQKAYQIVQQKENDLLLTIGGDHSIATATISAMRRHYQNLKIVWIDAHPDISNYKQKPIPYPNYHGMPLSHLTGITKIPTLDYWGWLNNYPLLNPKNVVQIAVRDIDPDQYESYKRQGIKFFTMDHIDKYGIGQVMAQTIKYLDPNNQHPFHISFDIDGIDPDLVGQTGTKFRYGLNGRQSMHIVRRLAQERKVVSMDLVEINAEIESTEPKRVPYRSQQTLNPMSRTVGLGVDLITSLCTKYLQQ